MSSYRQDQAPIRLNLAPVKPSCRRRWLLVKLRCLF